MSTTAVSCRGLQKSYSTDAQPVHALRGIDLDVAAGELLMLVGPSGCGKTTLISIIAGILEPSSGDCVVLGSQWQSLPPRDRARFRARQIGFVFQQYQLIPTVSIQQNVCVPLLIQGVDRRVAMARAAEALETVGLGDRLHSLPPSLSGGQQQRVAIARALVHSPQLIVCDEPTSALDHENGQRTLQLLRQITVNSNRSLIVVTHDSRIFDYADRIAEMDDGRITAIHQRTGNAHVI